MKKLIMASLIGMTLVFSACAHKHGGCSDGSCKMEKKECPHCAGKKEESSTAKPEDKK